MSARASRVAQATDDRQDTGVNRMPPAPGRQAILLAALVLGGLVLTLQLWLLTVALELYLEGNGDAISVLAALSGVVFAGGVVVLRMLSHHHGFGADDGD